MTAVPADLHYTSDHEWVRLEGDIATVGITAFAAQALGDIVYLELPAAGSTLTAGDRCGELESTKSVSDLYSPVDGEVIEANDALASDPARLGSEPYGQGWLFRVRVGAGAVDLLDAARYLALIGSA